MHEFAFSLPAGALDPENRIVDAIADAIGPVVFRELYNATQAECAQSRIVKRCGTGDVRDTNARMVDHDGKSCTGSGAHFPPAVRVSDVWVAFKKTTNLMVGVTE
jgi:hypothetical protein